MDTLLPNDLYLMKPTSKKFRNNFVVQLAVSTMEEKFRTLQIPLNTVIPARMCVLYAANHHSNAIQAQQLPQPDQIAPKHV